MSEKDFSDKKQEKRSLNEFVIKGQKIISYANETLPAAWIQRLENGASDDHQNCPKTEDSKILQADSTETLRNRLIEILGNATDTVCISSFLLADQPIIDAMLRASQRDVRVYLLTASETQLVKEQKNNNEFDSDRIQDHIRILKDLSGRVLVRTGENFHSKFIIADPHQIEIKGFLLTCNLTTEALTRNEEIGVELNSEEARDLYRQFLIGFRQESSNELLTNTGLLSVKAFPDDLLVSPAKLFCTTSKINTLKEAIEELVEASGEVIASSFGIDHQQETTQKLKKAATSGRKVRFLARPRPNKTTMNALIALQEAGVEVRGYPYLHAKCVDVNFNETRLGLVTTANIEVNGLDKGFETGIMLTEKDAEDLHDLLEIWWRNAPQQLFTKKRIGDIEGQVNLWKNETQQIVSIQKESIVNLGEFEAKSFRDMENFSPLFPQKRSSQENIIFHQVRFQWIVLPPRLPSGVERVPREGILEVYRRGKETFVVIETKNQLPEAEKIAAELSAKIVAKY